jgi:ethanolamine utilization protein EutN
VWKLVTTLSRAGLAGEASGRGEPLVAYDELGCGNGSLVAISEGAEAAAPFHPREKPIDAYCAALLDAVEFAKAKSH